MDSMAEVGVLERGHAAIVGRCRICGGTVGRTFSANGFSWFHCVICRTTQKVLTYPQYQNLNPTYDPGVFLDSCGRDQIEAFLDVDGATQVLTRVIDTFLQSKRSEGHRQTFLDVGCGMGRYLIAAQRLGFETLGFEPSANHARVAREHFDLPVVSDYFDQDRLDGKVFDLIMLSHVIEHIYDPKSFVMGLVQVLKPGGALIIITPNNQSLVARAVGKNWPMLKPVDHVSLIGSKAYAHFDLQGVADVHHSYSEYPFEFAASALAALKSFASSARRDRSTTQTSTPELTPPPLRAFGLKAKLLRHALAAISAPMHAAAIATNSQACLTSVVVRRTH
jgi:SAM-dependent methyltransferase